VHFDMDSEDAAIRAVLADGDPLARRTIRDALQSSGIVVVAEATTGREAIELAAFYRPDAVVMDVKLPVMDGVEATRTIHDRSPATCIVLLASEPDDTLGLARCAPAPPATSPRRSTRRCCRACCAAPSTERPRSRAGSR
jgi:DNA-binding NarL/FixJ family response regulator